MVLQFCLFLSYLCYIELKDQTRREKFVDLLTAKTNKDFVKMALKFNAALGCLAEERFIEKDELLNKETTAGMVVG